MSIFFRTFARFLRIVCVVEYIDYAKDTKYSDYRSR